MASRAYESLAADAASYLGKSAGADEGLGGGATEIGRQGECLVEWARARGVVLDDTHTAELEKYEETTSEHEVFYRRADHRAVKRTYPGAFGFANGPKGRQRPATPLFYLRRLQLMNKHFASDLCLEGVGLRGSGDERKPYAVVSQGWIDAANQADPHPSEAEIEAFMLHLGFRRMEDSCFKWCGRGVVVFDAKPDNFIRSVEGVVAIDLLVGAEYVAEAV